MSTNFRACVDSHWHDKNHFHLNVSKYCPDQMSPALTRLHSPVSAFEVHECHKNGCSTGRLKCQNSCHYFAKHRRTSPPRYKSIDTKSKRKFNRHRYHGENQALICLYIYLCDNFASSGARFVISFILLPCRRF